MYGYTFKYMPRTIVNQDFLLNEDPLSTFNLAVDVEMFIKDTFGFQGQGDFLSKLSALEIRDQITLTMARRRWEEIKTEKLLMEDGNVLLLESANTSAWGNSDCYMTEGANGYTITTPRPLEGDLVYFPLNKKLYEIKFVEHENMFYQFGKLYTYDLTLELFDRDNRLRTGNTEIDQIETRFTQDILFNKLLKEDGDPLLAENGNYLILEYRLEDTVPTANNEVFQELSPSVVDFSERSPFTEWD